MGSKRQMNFGWKVNRDADGFEQDHGRFTMEVYWHDLKRTWVWAIWADVVANGKREATVIKRSLAPTLADAKKAVLRVASQFERDALTEDQKFR